MVRCLRPKDRFYNDCAVKRIQLPANPKLVINEISILKECDHVNIPKLYDCFMVDVREIWLAMEYIHGLDVTEVVTHMILLPSQIATICHEVLCALQYLHNKRLIHRDVKGDNIFVNIHGHVYLGDMGLSTFENSNLGPLGTLLLFSP